MFSDPLVWNVLSLTACSSEEEVSRCYTVDPFGTRLFSKPSFWGRVWTIIDSPLSLVSDSANKKLQDLIHTVRTTLKSFARYAKGELLQLPKAARPLCFITFQLHSQESIQHAMQILGVVKERIPLALPQRAIASHLLEGLILRSTPWQVFDCIVQKKALTKSEDIQLKEWIGSVTQEGALISPLILLSIFEVSIQRLYPQKTPEEQSSLVFFLALQLFQLGLECLGSSMLGAPPVVHAIDDRPEMKLGNNLPPIFPIDMPIVAYEIPTAPSRMLLHSTAPLLLGMWLHNIDENPSGIPYLKIFSWGDRRQYVIVEKVLSSLAKVCWDPEGRTVKELGLLTNTLLNFPQTPELDPTRFFLSEERKVCLLSPLQKGHAFFHLHSIEQFLSVVCKDHLLEVLREASFFQHPLIFWHQDTFQRFGLDMSEQDLRRAAPRGIQEEALQQAFYWRTCLRGHLMQILQRIPPRPRDIIFPAIQQAILTLQEQHGFVTRLPGDFQDLVIEELKKKNLA